MVAYKYRWVWVWSLWNAVSQHSSSLMRTGLWECCGSLPNPGSLILNLVFKEEKTKQLKNKNKIKWNKNPQTNQPMETNKQNPTKHKKSPKTLSKQPPQKPNQALLPHPPPKKNKKLKQSLVEKCFFILCSWDTYLFLAHPPDPSTDTR